MCMIYMERVQISQYQFKCLNVLLNNCVVILMTSDELHIDLKKPTDT